MTIQPVLIPNPIPLRNYSQLKWNSIEHFHHRKCKWSQTTKYNNPLQNRSKNSKTIAKNWHSNPSKSLYEQCLLNSFSTWKFPFKTIHSVVFKTMNNLSSSKFRHSSYSKPNPPDNSIILEIFFFIILSCHLDDLLNWLT